MRLSKTRTAAAGAGMAALLAVSGCGFSGVYDVPLPGGADLGDHPYRVTVQFRDVLDLVPQAGVKVNEVTVGQVEKVGLAKDGWTAQATVAVNGDVDLPANAVANIRQSSLLGEKYVELAAPGTDRAEAPLDDGSTIPVERTNRSVEVEEVLGALSMLLNGGGVEQLNTITKELNNTLSGNEPQLKQLLHNADDLVSTLDAQSSDITRALDGLNRLSMTLNGQRDKIAGAIENLGPGIDVLERQRGQLVRMLQAFDELSGVAVDTINKSQDDLVANLKALLPTLQKLSEAGADLPNALKVLVSYPFTDESVKGAKGDYFNLYMDIDLNLEEVLKNLGRSRQNPLQDIPIVGDLTGANGNGSRSGLPLPSTDSAGSSSSTPANAGQGEGAQGGQQQAPAPSGPGGIFSVLSGGAG